MSATGCTCPTPFFAGPFEHLPDCPTRAVMGLIPQSDWCAGARTDAICARVAALDQDRQTFERAAWAATELGLQRDELQRRLSLASKALVWFYDDHVEEGDPPCPCTGCERARAAFKANLEPLPEASRG